MDKKRNNLIYCNNIFKLRQLSFQCLGSGGLRDFETPLFCPTPPAPLLQNTLYFLVQPYLPEVLVHERFQIDVGLFFDFGTCLLVYWVIHRSFDVRG